MKALAGIAIVAAHLAGFAWLADRSRGRELAISAPGPVVASAPDGPGLVHRRWAEHYRGGFTRSVGATQLAGPFQDPAAPACSGRVVVGQRMLDQLAAVMRREIHRQLVGTSVFPVGDYKRVKALSLRWVTGAARVTATIAFARVDVPVTVTLTPRRKGDTLSFAIAAEADLDFDNRVLQWVSDKVGADKLATRVAREQVARSGFAGPRSALEESAEVIDDVLVTTLAPPPPFELSHGQTLQFVYCDGPIEIVDGSHAALPFAVRIATLAGSPDVLPPRFATGSRVTPTADTLLAIDLDVDALNALLYELWRTGWLDARLAEVGLDRRFNTDPIVTEYLSLRISPPRLALPPVVSPAGDAGWQLAADARVAIADGTRTTTGRVFGALAFRFAGAPSTELSPRVDLGALELSCERDATTLVPCYGDLVATMRDRGDEFQGALTEAFAALLADIFVGRHVGAAGVPAEIVIENARPSLVRGGTLHLELAAKLAPVP
jgi:hypothetical protein